MSKNDIFSNKEAWKTKAFTKLLHDSVHSRERFPFTKATKHTFGRRHPLLQRRAAGLGHKTRTNTIILLLW